MLVWFFYLLNMLIGEWSRGDGGNVDNERNRVVKECEKKSIFLFKQLENALFILTEVQITLHHSPLV